MTDDLMKQYDAGRFDMAVSMAPMAIANAASAANYLFQTANAKADLTGGDLIVLRQLRVQLLNAVGTIEKAIDLARPKLLQAAE